MKLIQIYVDWLLALFSSLQKRRNCFGEREGRVARQGRTCDSRFVLASLSPLFAETTQKTCSAGYVFRAMEKEKITFIKSVIVINLQILLLEYIFCNFILLVICRDFISHTILRNVNTGIKRLLLWCKGLGMPREQCSECLNYDDGNLTNLSWENRRHWCLVLSAQASL